MKLITRVLKWAGIATLVVVLVGGVLLVIAYWRSTNDCESNATTPANPMRAILSCEYGVENLELRDIEKPTPADNEVLVRVRAASVNPADGHLIRDSWLGRLLGGLRKPKNTRFGTDFAGIVEAVGVNVPDFKPGDEVFGAKNGAVADYICVKADRAIVMKPSNITFEQAGSVVIAGVTALQGLRDKGRIKAGETVLINGASGGVGTFAVQIAKAFGAEVTAVCSTRNLELVKSIGADHVIDYTREDFTKTDRRYDLIYDLVGNHGFSQRRKILTPNGICVLAGIGGAGVNPESRCRFCGIFWNGFL
jgi:NADPH:quinone reductase-like Zn-dependent oxidoreductase